jgi:hypothetical protein
MVTRQTADGLFIEYFGNSNKPAIGRPEFFRRLNNLNLFLGDGTLPVPANQQIVNAFTVLPDPMAPLEPFGWFNCYDRLSDFNYIRDDPSLIARLLRVYHPQPHKDRHPFELNFNDSDNGIWPVRASIMDARPVVPDVSLTNEEKTNTIRAIVALRRFIRAK